MDAEMTLLLCTVAALTLLAGFLLGRLHTLGRLRKLQEREKHMTDRIHEILDTMPLLYMYEEMITDDQGQIVETRYLDINRYFNDCFYTREACIGKLGSELFPDSMPVFLEASNRAKQTGKALNFQYFYPQTERFYDIMVRPVDEGRYMEYYCMDCTELHTAQEALRALNKKMEIALEAAHVQPWRYELDSHLVYSHDPASTGKDNIAQPVSRVYTNIHADDRMRIRESIQDLIAGKQERVKEECRLLPTDADSSSQTEWVEVRAAVGTRDADGHPLTLVGSCQTITSRKQMEEELLAAKSRAEDSNRLKSSFLSNMSHEIRTPLSAIVGFSELLASAETPDERAEYVHIIQNNSDLLLQLVNDILDLSKIEAGTVDFAYTDFDLNQLLKEIHDAQQLRLAASGRPVTLSYRPGLESCIIHSERNRLTQLISNLLANARKFTDAGSITFGYELQGDQLRFSVSDTGCGIPPERQPTIFDRFVKLDPHRPGTGLGLSICRSIVETLGGQIGVESEVGHGSTFWFTIPYQPASPAPQTLKSISTTVSPENRATILVAEDNESNYKLIRAILSRDYDLFHAWDGREAVQLFGQCHPQLILMDISMPVMDGYEATAQIRQQSANVPILALTAYAYPSDQERILHSGMNAYLSKPVNTQQLRAKVEELIRQGRAKE